MKVSVHTFGCKLNQYESEALASAFRSRGFSLVPPGAAADVCVVNTCTVTSRSDQKARRLIRHLSRAHPQARILVTGCYAQLAAQEVAALGPNVTVVAQDRKEALLQAPALLAGGGQKGLEALQAFLDGAPRAPGGDPFAFQVRDFSFHSRGFLKIQDGCNGCCAYCRVPLARGPSISLGAEEAVRRLVQLEEAGYGEVVLTGVNICAYEGGLEALLRRMLAETRGVRLRLSSLEPEAVTASLAGALAHPRIRPHFHLSLQSGSPVVLRRMRRRYEVPTVAQAAARLRGAKDDPFLAADVIVGFPGEEEGDFQATARLVERLGLAALHVFPFSPRPGTEAAGLGPRIPERVRHGRAAELRALSERLTRAYAGRWEGRELEGVLEVPAGAGGTAAWRVLTENYLQLEITGVPAEARRGGLVRVEVQRGAPRPGRGRFLGPAAAASVFRVPAGYTKP
jgi:threonylcarbamoyladenosine tRNA methylthiotransferase MtaB